MKPKTKKVLLTLYLGVGEVCVAAVVIIRGIWYALLALIGLFVACFIVWSLGYGPWLKLIGAEPYLTWWEATYVLRMALFLLLGLIALLLSLAGIESAIEGLRAAHYKIVAWLRREL